MILFEWKLIARNKRLQQMLFFMLLLIAYFYMMLLSSNFILIDYFIWRMLFLVGMFSMGGVYYGVVFLSINASFIEILMITPNALFNNIRAKYYLYATFSLISFLCILPTLALGMNIGEIVSSFLFSIGFMCCAFFRCALFSYEPINIKGTGFQSWQGFTFYNQLLVPAAIFLLATILIASSNSLLGKYVTLIVMSITGVCFIIAHKWWIKRLCKKIEKTKYKRLEYFAKK